MPQRRLQPPEAIQRGGFQGGVHVTPQQAPNDGRLTELAAALGNFNQSFSRAAVTRETGRVDALRDAAPDEARLIIEQDLAGYNAEQVGAAIDTELGQRLQENPYLLPVLRRHQGTLIGQARIARMTEEVDVRDRDAVQEWLEANPPDLGDDRFVAAGFNETSDRWLNQVQNMQLHHTLSTALEAREDAYATDFRRAIEDGGVEAAFAAAQQNGEALEIGGRDASRLQLTVAAGFAEAGDVETARAIIETQRGDAPSLLRDARTSADAGQILDQAELNYRQNNAERWDSEVGAVLESVVDGTIRTEVQLDAALQERDWPAGEVARVRLRFVSEREQRARETAAEMAALEREAERDALFAGVLQLSSMADAGASWEEIQATDIFQSMETEDQYRFGSTLQTRTRTTASRNAAADADAWDADFEANAVGRAIIAAQGGDFATFEDVVGTNPHNGSDRSISRSELSEQVVEFFRGEMLGPTPWGHQGEDVLRYQMYTRFLASNGQTDPQLGRFLSGATALLTPQGIQTVGDTSTIEQAAAVFEQIDPRLAPSYVSDDYTRGVLTSINRIRQQNPAMEFSVVVQTAVATETATERPVSVSRDFSRAEGSIDYRIEDPLRNGRRVNVRRARSSAGTIYSDPTFEVRQYANELFNQYRSAGRSVETAADMVNQNIASEFTVWNDLPLRMPPNRTNGEVTAPEQWATNVDAYMSSLAEEVGIEDHTSLSITHATNGLYHVSLPDGSIRLIRADQILAEGALYRRFSNGREEMRAATEASERDRNR